MVSRLIPLCVIAFVLGGWVCPAVGQDGPQSTLSGQSLKPANKNQPDNEAPVSGNAPHKRNPRYRLHLGDVVELTFPFTPEFDQTVTVQPDGFITLRDIGDMHAEGETTSALASALRTAYGKILHDPEITVNLTEFEQPYFVVGGEVGHPGKFELHSDTTVTEAVAIAGGFRDTAKHSQVLLIRKVSDQWAEVKVLDIKKMLQTRDLQEDPHLHPGDMLYVPKNMLSKVKPFIPIPGIGMGINPTGF